MEQYRSTGHEDISQESLSSSKINRPVCKKKALRGQIFQHCILVADAVAERI